MTVEKFITKSVEQFATIEDECKKEKFDKEEKDDKITKDYKLNKSLRTM